MEPAAKDPILGVTEAFLADPSPDKVNVGVVSISCTYSGFFFFFFFFNFMVRLSEFLMFLAEIVAQFISFSVFFLKKIRIVLCCFHLIALAK